VLSRIIDWLRSKAEPERDAGTAEQEILEPVVRVELMVEVPVGCEDLAPRVHGASADHRLPGQIRLPGADVHVFMIMLAAYPMRTPTTSQMMKFIRCRRGLFCDRCN
jgi:hypothetical protein